MATSWGSGRGMRRGKERVSKKRSGGKREEVEGGCEGGLQTVGHSACASPGQPGRPRHAGLRRRRPADVTAGHSGFWPVYSSQTCCAFLRLI